MRTAKVSMRAVGEDEAGLRLDRWFHRHYPNLAHHRLEKLLRTGQVRLDGRRTKSGERIAAGQIVRVPPMDVTVAAAPASPSVSAEDADLMLSAILYRDDDLLVLNKPPGLAVQGGSGTTRHVDGLLETLRGDAPERPRLVHRLDKHTSGLLVVARHARAAQALTAAFKAGLVRKCYWAVTAGVPHPLAGRIDAPLAKQRGGLLERVAVDREAGLAAVTLYQVPEYAAKRAARVVLWPLTGRTHQLRVHLALLGTPILGDGKYGGQRAFLPGGGVSQALHLHARRLLIPRLGAPDIDINAPLPPNMRATWSWFGFDETDPSWPDIE